MNSTSNNQHDDALGDSVSDQLSREAIKKPQSKFTFSQGIDLYLTHNGNRFCVNGSSWNGTERVYVNGELSSRRFNPFTRRGVHIVNCEGTEYRIEFIVESIFKGELRANLYTNDTLVDSDFISLDDHLSQSEKQPSTNTSTEEETPKNKAVWSFVKSKVPFFLCGFFAYWLVTYIFG